MVRSWPISVPNPLDADLVRGITIMGECGTIRKVQFRQPNLGGDNKKILILHGHLMGFNDLDMDPKVQSACITHLGIDYSAINEGGQVSLGTLSLGFLEVRLGVCLVCIIFGLTLLGSRFLIDHLVQFILIKVDSARGVLVLLNLVTISDKFLNEGSGPFWESIQR